MAEKDLSEKGLLEFPDVFADVYNTVMFGGVEVLTPEELRPVMNEHISNPGGRGFKQLFRDVVMENVVTGIRYMILGIENQSRVDETMPLRGMGMDYAAYERQLKLRNVARKRHRTRKRKLLKAVKRGKAYSHGKLVPVITLVLYYGQANWTGPRTLIDMIHMPEEKKYPGIRKYIHDYGMNLVVLKDLKREDVECFRSDFKYLVDYLQSCRNPTKQELVIKQDDLRLDHRQETLLALTALSGDTRYADLVEKEEEETMGRCQLWDYLENKGKTQGRYCYMIEQISKKSKRGLSISQIAEQVEEDETLVETICKAIAECGSDCTSEAVYAKLNL